MNRGKLGLGLAFAAFTIALIVALVTSQSTLLNMIWALMWGLWVFGIVLHLDRAIFLTAMVDAALLMVFVILIARLTTPCYYWFCNQ